MTRVIAVVTLIATGSSCVSQGGKHREALVLGGVLMIVGGGALAANRDAEQRREEEAFLPMPDYSGALIGLLIAGGLFGFLGTAAMNPQDESSTPPVDSHHARPRRPWPPPPLATSGDPVVDNLTAQARTAALDGRCSIVEMIGREVEARAPQHYRDVFQKEPSIAGCL